MSQADQPSISQYKPTSVVGGGPKKVLYTLQTLSRIGLMNSAKALKSHNTCKACGLGMGGQQGGMTNELDEFPSVCNKSIQAQSTDIQQPIPDELFKHSLEEFRQLSRHELEHLGRLNTPLYKAADSQHYQPISWEDALTKASDRLKQTVSDQAFFYASGRSSNEAGFALQLLARLFGTNNVTNCSYYCHQASGVGLGSTLGTGTATVELEDLTRCDLVFLIGANPASNHPRLMHKLQALRDRGGQVVVINPAKESGLVKFAVPKSPRSMLKGGTEIASHYLQPHIGSDLWVLLGIAKSTLENHQQNADFISSYCNGFNQFKQQLRSLEWESICTQTGLEQSEIEEIANLYSTSKASIFAWGMGVTHQLHGSETVEAIANLALLRGMVGHPGAGLLPLRGHSNVQGIGTIGVKPVLPEQVYQALETELDVELPRTAGLDTLATLEAAHEGKMDFALLMGGNLLDASPNRQWAEQALDRIKSKLYLTTTLNLGHFVGMENSEAIILPVTARDEEPESTTQESMFNFVRLSNGGIQRLNKVRSESHILLELIKRVIDKPSLDFSKIDSHKNLRACIAKVIPGMEQLKDIDKAQNHQATPSDSNRADNHQPARAGEFHVANRLLKQPAFNLPEGKAKFATVNLPSQNSESEYPFKLMTVRSEGQFNSIIYEENDSYRGTKTRWCVLMSPQDMLEQGLTPDSRVTLSSAYGEMKELAVVPYNLARGNLMAYYPEANLLVGTERDPRSQTPAFKNVAVSLKRN